MPRISLRRSVPFWVGAALLGAAACQVQDSPTHPSRGQPAEAGYQVQLLTVNPNTPVLAVRSPRPVLVPQPTVNPSTPVVSVRSPRPGLSPLVKFVNQDALVAQKLIEYTNNSRLLIGRPALVQIPALSRIAREHSKGKTLYYEQNKTVEDRLRDAGITSSLLGKNIIVMADRPDPAWSLMYEGTVGLARNKEQYANIINPDFTQFGVGVYRSPDDGNYYVTQIFIKPMPSGPS